MKNCVRFDWFSFTIKNRGLEKVLADLGLNPEEFKLNSFSRYGYRNMIVHEVFDIAILFDGTEDMGIHVTVSGGSIKYFMECYSKRNGIDTPFGKGFYTDMWQDFAGYVLANGNFSRVDVNIDTDMPFMCPFNLRDLVRAGDMVSLYRSWKFIEGADGSSTLYLGQRSSSSFIRIYDKAKEQGDYSSTLYRFEVQFNKCANTFMQNFLDMGLAEAFRAFVDRQLRFVAGGAYSDAPYEQWIAFVTLISNSDYDFRNYDEKKRKNCINTLFHMFNQYHNTVADFMTYYGNMDDFIEYMITVFGSVDGDNDNVLDYLQKKGWGDL